MGISYKFMDDCSYGADDINSVFSKLTTQGVSLFNYSDNDNPLIDLNTAVSNFTTSGIEYYNTDSCKLSFISPDDENPFGTFEILPGNAFMYDGSIITIDDNKYDITEQVHSLRLLTNDNIYVYFYRNVPYNSIDILVTNDTSQLELQETVLLGIIDSENKITDKRSFATSKIAPCSGNIVLFGKYDGEFRVIPANTGADRLRFTIKDVFPGAKYVFIRDLCLTIQDVNTATGDELTYTDYPTQLATVHMAANRIGNDVQIWMYTINASVLFSYLQYTIF